MGQRGEKKERGEEIGKQGRRAGLKGKGIEKQGRKEGMEKGD